MFCGFGCHPAQSARAHSATTSTSTGPSNSEGSARDSRAACAGKGCGNTADKASPTEIELWARRMDPPWSRGWNADEGCLRADFRQVCPGWQQKVPLESTDVVEIR